MLLSVMAFASLSVFELKEILLENFFPEDLVESLAGKHSVYNYINS